jgi:uncharacterized protein (TIGR02145 family)
MEDTNQIYFYKFISPYSGDITKNGKLTTDELDNNFKIFKENTIKKAYFNSEDYSLTIEKYNLGKKIVIDLSPIKDEIKSISNGNNRLEEISLNGVLNEDGTLTLSLGDDNKIEINGFINKINHDISLSGDGTNTNPLSVSELNKTNLYRLVKGIVDELPNDNLSVNDKYIKRESYSSFGTLYSVRGMKLIKKKLENNHRKWRVPTKEDWNNLKSYVNECDCDDISGKLLKSTSLWNGNDALDSYGFNIYPTGYANDSKQLMDIYASTRFITATKTDKKYVVETIQADSDDIKEIESENGYYYSIRLVCDCSSNPNIESNDILGKNYKTLYIEELGQLWMLENFNYNFSDLELSIMYNYGANSQINTIYTINNWNGNDWDIKQLIHGDNFSLVENDKVLSDYKVLKKFDNNYILFKTFEYGIYSNGDVIAKIDVGWY